MKASIQMRKLSILGLICLFVFVHCKSPVSPDVKEIVNPEARILFNVSPNPILYYYGFTKEFIITLTEHNGVSAHLDGVWIIITYDGFIAPQHWSSEEWIPSAYGYIRIPERQIPAYGKVDVACKLWLPLYVVPVEAEIGVNMTDKYGKQHGIIKKIGMAHD